MCLCVVYVCAREREHKGLRGGGSRDAASAEPSEREQARFLCIEQEGESE